VAGLLIVLLVWYMAVTTFLTDSALAQSAGASLIRRLDIWRLSLQLVKAQPVTGIGLGNYEAVFTAAFPTLPLVGGRLAPPHAHNLFLQVALDVGLPGLVAHLGLLALLLRSVGSRLWTPRRRRTTIFATSAVAIGVYGALVALLVIGCFDNALWGTKLTLIPWTLFALAFLVGEGESFHAAVR
jgi:putative inorganic carbon (HCO3(-)) transporter